MSAVRFYIRMSRKKQENSPEAQRADLEQWISQKPKAPKERFFYFDLAISGEKPFLDRLEAQRLIEDLEEGDWVVVSKIDRLGRDTRDILNTVYALREAGGRLHIVDWLDIEYDDNNPMCQMMLMVLAWAAQQENRLRVERVASAKRMLNASGQYTKGQPPFGYKLVKRPVAGSERLGTFLEEDPHEQKAIVLMREWWTRGLSGAEIRRRLSARGFRSRNGGKITHTQIMKLCRRIEEKRAKRVRTVQAIEEEIAAAEMAMDAQP